MKKSFYPETYDQTITEKDNFLRYFTKKNILESKEKSGFVQAFVGAKIFKRFVFAIWLIFLQVITAHAQTPVDQNFDSQPTDPTYSNTFTDIDGVRYSGGPGADRYASVSEAYNVSPNPAFSGRAILIGNNVSESGGYAEFFTIDNSTNFKLVSLKIETYPDSDFYASEYTIIGYDNGVQIVAVDVNMRSSGTYGSGNNAIVYSNFYTQFIGDASGLLSFGSSWGNIDQVRFRIKTPATGYYWVGLDDIDFSTAVAPATAPSVTSNSATSTTSSGATLNGNVTADGGASVTARGFVYSTSDNTPTIGEGGVTNVADGSGTGAFSEAISGLSASTTYYYQAYATNSVGTSYGGVESFTTASAVPTVTDANISISGATGTGGAFKIGDTVTATWNNTAGGDNNSGITGVTVNFSQFGGGSAVAATNSSGTWTATYSITAGAIDASNRNISVTATDNSGNATTTADTSNATVDNVAPTVTNANISISGATGTGGAFKIGDTVTATWNNTAGGDNNSDTVTGVTVDFSQFGGGSAVAATNSSGTWTATYSITAGAIDASNRNISVTATDNSGNATTTADTSNATVDNVAPTVTNANISISGATGTGGAFKIGDTVTATWNNTAGGDNNSDVISFVSIDFSQFGGGSAVAATNSSGTWTATYSITAGAIDASNRNVSVTATDNSGNATTTADTSNATVDNVAPTVTDANISISGASGTGGAFKIGDTVTAVWNNTAGGDNNSDVISFVSIDFSQFGGGAAVSATNSSGTWIATYTITAGAIDASNRNISVTATDNSGSATTTADTSNARVDTQRPTATLVVSDSQLTVGETSLVTITFSEAVTGFTNADLTVANGSLSSVSSSDGGITWTATLTPSAGISDATNVITLNNTGIADQAGNTGSGTTDSNNYAIDTQRPTATLVVSDTQLTVGETSLVTITFSEAVTGFTNADLTVANGTLSSVSSADGGITWTATLTPSAGISDATNVITLNNTGIADQAGNTGSGTTDSNNYAIDTQRPTATLVVSDTQLTVGETSLVTITFSEAVTGFTNADLTVANGSLSGLSSSDGGITWTATLTPSAGISDATNVITLNNTGIADQGGNTGSGTTDSNNYAIDTQRPTATIVVSDTQLTVGETSLVTITFSEAVTGFTNADLTVANGTLSSVSSADGGITWTATLTPSAGISDATNVITLDNTGIADQGGNTGSGTTDSNNYAIDTNTPAGYSVAIDQSSINGVNENAVSFTFADAEVGTLYNYSFSSSGGSGTVQASGTISSSDQQISAIDLSSLPDGLITLVVTLTDPAGNVGGEVSDSVNKFLSAVLTIITKTQAAEDNSHGEFEVVTDNLFAVNTTVTILVAGTATNGTDYTTIGNSFVFPANTSSVIIPVSVIADIDVEGDETVIITIVSTDNTLVSVGESNEATVTIEDNDVPRQLTITPEPNQQKVYGSTDPGTIIYTASGFDQGDDQSIIQGSLTREAGEVVDTYSLTLGDLDAGPNYELVLNPEVFTITAKSLTITVDANQSKVYGADDPTFTYTATGFENEDDESILTGALARATGESVGTYAINQGTLTANDNYEISFIGSNFAITQKTLTITVNQNQSKVYGQTDPTFTYTATGFENGDDSGVLTGALARATGENVGNYAINQGTLTAGDNYEISFIGSNFAITEKTLTITANSNQSKIYGASDPTLTYTATGFENGDDSGVLTGALARATGESVGTYAINQGTLSAGVNYTVNFIGADFAITQKTLTITANSNQSKIYGASDPTLTYTATGFENEDDESILTGALARVAGESVGTYAINQGSLGVNGNYTINFIGADFAITQKTLTITANQNQSKVYGSMDPAFTYMATGFENEDEESILTGTLARAAGENAGNYAINRGTLSAGDNYTINFIGEDFAITKASIIISADDKQKVYGQANPTLTFTYDGLVNGDTKVTTEPSIATTATQSSNVGTYPITLTGGADQNYTITLVNGTLTIGKKDLTITADDKQKVYGQANPTLTLSYTGLVNGDTKVTTEPSIATTATVSSNVGTYPITLTGGADQNYSITLVNGTLTIGKKDLTIKADDKQKVYGEANPALTFSYTGLVNGNMKVSTEPSISTTATLSSNVGTYAITLTGGMDENYTITLVNGTLTITKATLKIHAIAQSKIFGSSDPDLTFTATGFTGTDNLSSLTGKLAREAGEQVGVYTIGLGTLKPSNNYELEFTSAQFEIIPAQLLAISDPIAITTPWSVSPTLPNSLSAVTADGQVVQLGVSWNQTPLNLFKRGSYFLTGVVTLPSGILNPEGLSATLEVRVLAKPAPQDVTLSNDDFDPDPKNYFQVIGSFTVIDPIDNQHTITLVPGAGDNQYFEVKNGILFWSSSEEASGKTQFTVVIRVEDRDGNVMEKSFTINRGRTDLTELEVFNSFTPNGDGINDTWGVPDLRYFTGVRVQVFDRNGERLFYTEDADTRWDGTYKGKEMPVGTYFWIVEVIETGKVRRGILTILKN